MNKAERRRLNALADEMLTEASVVGKTRLYSATGHSKQNISIIHQQVRCANLAWALRWRRKLKNGSVIAIVGGSFSGLMLACSIAIADDVIVYIIERERRLLHRFFDKSQRFLSPNLNSRDLRKRFNPNFSEPIYRPAIFNWTSGVASDVASSWLREFDQYAAKLPIFTLLGAEVVPEAISETDGKVQIQLAQSGRITRQLSVDVLIDATGFGPEANPLKVIDYSYWEGGHRLIYDHLPPKSRVLVSGCGDSGIVELMHYALANFDHEMIKGFWPSGTNLEAHLDVGLENIKSIINYPEVERYDYRIISELCWWLDHWWKLQNWSRHELKAFTKRSSATIFTTIDRMLAIRIAAAFPGLHPTQITWEQREDFLLQLPISEQVEIRSSVVYAIDEVISRDIDNHMKQVRLSRLLNTRELRKMIRSGVQIVLNGLTSTPFTRNLSPYNIWLMKVAMSLPNVEYLQGRITSLERAPNGQSIVTIGDTKREVFDRVVTRYGPNGDAQGLLGKGTLRDSYLGDFLLTSPSYLIPGQSTSFTGRTMKRVEPARDRVEKRVPQVMNRRGHNPSNPISKTLYVSSLMETETGLLLSDSRYLDPQRSLIALLKTGKRPVYQK